MAKDYVKDCKGKCITCKEYNLGYINVGGYRCSKLQRYMAVDASCYRYSNDITRGNKVIEDAIKKIEKRGYSPTKSNYYIVSFMCALLGLPKDCEYMTYFEALVEYMKTNPTGLMALQTYDTFGILIRNSISEEYYNDNNVPRRVPKVVKTIRTYMDYIVEGIKKTGNYEVAMLIFMQLVDSLKDHYQIYDIEPEISTSELDLLSSINTSDEYGLNSEILEKPLMRIRRLEES